jgi:hypothetical protein
MTRTSRRLLAPLGLAGVVVAATIALRVRDPHAGGWGTCPFLLLTGLPCPVCGGLRAVNDLTHGDVVGALSSNLVVVAMLPVAALWWIRWARRCVDAPEGTAAAAVLPAPSPTVTWVTFVLVVGFGVLRWLPAAAWLAP